MKYSENCPACGFALGFQAWDGGSASDEICPSCGIQFGYDDVAGGNQEGRRYLYVGWRLKWRKDGCRWSSKRPPPHNWNPEVQLERAMKI